MRKQSILSYFLRPSVCALAITLLTTSAFATSDNPYSNGARAELVADYATAMEQYELAATAGLTDAMFALGRLYADIYGDDAEALRWYQKAAQQGHTFAQVALGQTYLDGSSATAPNPTLAMYWLESAATQGRSSDAALILFQLDPYSENASYWLTKAAEAGRPEAMVLLAHAYANGDYGFPVDLERSARWYALAATAKE